MFNKYNVIVVGAGHAGCEAAAAAANLGSSVLLITMNMGVIAQMSCNPAIGGVAKGQIVREIDAMGGYTGIIADKSTIQFRMLNKSKGPAMWSPRTTGCALQKNGDFNWSPFPISICGKIPLKKSSSKMAEQKESLLPWVSVSTLMPSFLPMVLS